MAINVTTLIHPVSVRFTFEGKWTWQELSAATNQSKGYLQSLPAGTPIIFDLTKSAGIPQGGLSRIPEIMKRAHKHAGFAICVADQNSHTGRLLHEIFAMIQNIYGLSWDIRYVDHYHEAIQYIELNHAV